MEKQLNSLFRVKDVVFAMNEARSIICEKVHAKPATVIEIKPNGFVRLRFSDDTERNVKERFVSFTPFSYEDGGFSQELASCDGATVGDWGFFYNEIPANRFFYGRLKKIEPRRDSCYRFTSYRMGNKMEDMECNGRYFSHTMPELEKGVPIPNFNQQSE